MPAVSEKQKRFMQAVAHNKGFAKKVGVPQSVGREFSKAKGGSIMKKLFGGKESYKEELGEAKAVKSGRISPKQFVKGEKSEGHGREEKGLMGMAKKIKSGKMSPSKYAKMEAKETYARGGGIEVRGKTKGKMVKMARGGGIEVRGNTKGKFV
jgi:hypothetical protein